jgi:hypothetical protein
MASFPAPAKHTVYGPCIILSSLVGFAAMSEKTVVFFNAPYVR